MDGARHLLTLTLSSHERRLHVALDSRQASFDTAATRPAQDDVKVFKMMQDQQVKNIDVILSSRS